MPVFAYTARDSSGQPFNGTMSADSVSAVSQSLRGEGKYPVSVRPADEIVETPETGGGAGVKISRADVIQFATQLSIMVETGVTLSDALDCISKQSEKPAVKKLVTDLYEQLQSGSSLSDAMLRHPKSFPRLFVALISASEKSGLMSKLLNRACTYLRDEQETLRRVKGALTYPGIMLAFALSTTVFLLAFVLPRFTVIYANKKAALPLPTKLLMGLSDGLVSHWLVLTVGLVTVVGSIWFYVKTDGGARVWHFIQLRLPLLGPMFRKLHLSRGLRMVGTMAGAGVPLMDCVSTAHDLCGNSYFRDLWDDVTEKIQAGHQLSEPLFESALVPRGVAQMIHSGEKGGKVAYVMEQVAGYSEQELKEQIANITRYIEPAMIIIMGMIIGSVALALLLPIFTISKVMAS